MPHVSFKTQIDAPFERVADLLQDKIESPRKFVGAVLWSKIVERGDDFVIREMYQPRPSGLLIKERIYTRPLADGEEVVFQFVDNARYTGQMRNILTRLGGRDDRCTLEFKMEWTPRPEMPEQMSDEMAIRFVERSVLHTKDAAEHPPRVPAWLRDWYATLDSRDPEAMASWLTDDASFRFGNDTDIIGRDAVMRANQDILGRLKSVKYQIVGVYEDQGTTVAELFVDHELQSGEKYLLPMISLITRDNGKVASVKVYGDPSPLRHGWPAP